MTHATSRARRTTTGWLLMAATALALPLGAPPAAATVGAVDVESPTGEVVVVTVNAHQRDIDDARMNELVAGLGTRVGLTPTAADVIVVEEITQTGLLSLRDKLNTRMNASYAVVGLSSNAGLTSDVKVKLLLNTATMDYTGRTSWLDVCDSVRLYQTVTAREKASGKELAVAGVHLAPTSNATGDEDCRTRNAAKIREQLAPYDDRGSVIGDFNRRAAQTEYECDPEELSAPMDWYSAMTATVGGHAYLDAVRTYRRAAGLTMQTQWTYENATATATCSGATAVRRMRLDYVFASDVLTPVSAGTDDPGWGGADPGTVGCSPAPTCKYSDHRFVWAQLRLPAAPQPIHVGDLDGVRTTVKSGWRATAAIRVHSAQEAPVAGVVVSGRWSNSTSTQTCTTDATGTCSLTSGLLKTSSVRLTVTGLQSFGAAYSGVNHDPDLDSNGTSIDIWR